jgi:hypothetical protein
VNDFGREHFADILLAVLIVLFMGAAVGCALLMIHIGSSNPAAAELLKLAEIFAGVASGNLVGALVMRLRTSTDPAVMALLKNGNGNGDAHPPVAADAGVKA